MALLDDVKSELAAIDNELPIAKKAQATAMIRFGNGLHSVDHHILVQVQLDSQDAAAWLQDTIKNLYGHEATLTPVSRQTPTGTVQRYVIRVPKGSTALVLQTGLYSRYTKQHGAWSSKRYHQRQNRADQVRMARRVPRQRTSVRSRQGQLS